MWDDIAFGALIKRKRGEKRFTQQTLAEYVFGDPTRKSDISRIETAKLKPQEATIQRLCDALEISDAEMEPIRQARLTAQALDQVPTLSRDDLELLAARFDITGVPDRSDEDLRRLLTLKAQEYRALKSEVDAIEDGLKRLSNLKAAAQDAIACVDLEKVEELLSRVQEVEKEEAAKTAEPRADNALLRGRVDQAYALLCDAADSFAIIDPLEPTRRRNDYEDRLFRHGYRYGSKGIAFSEQMLRVALDRLRKGDDPLLWASIQNNLGIALQTQGTRTEGPEGAALLAEAVTAYRDALTVRTRADHAVQWATTQNNLAIALLSRAAHDSTDDPRPDLTAALAAVEAALTVYDPEHMSYDHGTATRLRDDIQAALDAL